MNASIRLTVAELLPHRSRNFTIGFPDSPIALQVLTGLVSSVESVLDDIIICGEDLRCISFAC